jgi:putative ABC transport system permease protein
MTTLVEIGPPLAVALVTLVLFGSAVAVLGELGHGRNVLTAALRAGVQLALVALLLTAIVGSLAASLGFVVAMYAVATVTAGRRLVRSRCGLYCAIPIGAGTLPVVASLLALGVVPAKGVAVVPIAGILLGGAMTATVMAGRKALAELRTQAGEVEAAQALGLSDRDAALMVCRPAASEALVPALDQTRTVGLVTLPGAFVGTLLGGATPLEAGAVQVLILVAVVAVQAVAVVATVELIARGVLSRLAVTYVDNS